MALSPDLECIPEMVHSHYTLQQLGPARLGLRLELAQVLELVWGLELALGPELALGLEQELVWGTPICLHQALKQQHAQTTII